jgi:molecular chaperone GrpE (heat shock protein)
MGHNIGVSGHYYRPTESEVLQDYLKAIDPLTIGQTQRLQKENQKLKSEQAQEIAQLRAEFDKYKKITKEIIDQVQAYRNSSDDTAKAMLDYRTKLVKADHWCDSEEKEFWKRFGRI